MRKDSIAFLLTDGEPGADTRSSSRNTLHNTGAAQFRGALTHREQPNTYGALRWNAHAIVMNHNLQALRQREPDHTSPRLCVADNVGYRLLNDAIDGHLHRCRQGREAVGGLDADVEAGVIIRC